MREVLYITPEQSLEWHNYLNKFGPSPESFSIEFEDKTVITIMAGAGQVLVSGVYYNGEIITLINSKYSNRCLLAGFELTDMYEEYIITVEVTK